MDNASRYWKLVQINSSGDIQMKPMPTVQAWIEETFAEWITVLDATESKLQHQLLHIWRNGKPRAELALLSLRCCVTHYIRYACRQLANQFGETYGFTAADLIPLVLDDDGDLAPRYCPFALEVLETYQPGKATLSTWVGRLTRNHPEINRALMERGLYRASDWAILNDTTAEQAERILRIYHQGSEADIAQALRILHQYHQVYLRDRLAQRQQSRKGGICKAPTVEQLRQMDGTADPRILLDQLKHLATQLRQYRIHARSGNPVPYQGMEIDWEQMADTQSTVPPEAEDDQAAFVADYRRELLQCLDEAIAQGIQANVDRLKTKTPPKDRIYVQGISLFYCEGISMGKLAPYIGLTSQVQVNRLLELKRLRTDVRHHLLAHLYPKVRQQALQYVSADRLSQIDRLLEQLLSEEVEQLINEDQTKAQNPKGQTTKSLFAHQLCQTIHQFSSEVE
jgi:hypothetical protein